MNTTSATEPAAWTPDAPTPPPVTYVDEARIPAFVAMYQLGEYVEPTIRLAREHFTRARGIAVYVDGESGTDDERLMIDVAMEEGISSDEFLRQRRAFEAAWNAGTPPAATDWICVTHNFR